MSSSQQPRFWDGRRNQYYFYDSTRDELVYQDGSRFRRPDSVPRTTFTAKATIQVANAAPQQGQHTNVPPNYVFNQEGTGARGQANQRPAPNVDPGRVAVHLDNLRIAEAQRHEGQQTTSRDPQPATAQPQPIRSAMSTSRQASQEPSSGSIRRVSFTDPKNRVSVAVQTGPPEQITDPDLYREGARAARFLLETEGDTERLFPDFKKRTKDAKHFFKVGKVFLTLWSEPAGDRTSAATGASLREPGITMGPRGERVYSQVRRFVVIREGSNYCSAIPVTRYSSQGVGKRGVRKSEHTIIYTGKQVPAFLPGERPNPGESGMRGPAIRVDPDQKDEKLDPLSRLNLAQIHTIQHYLKVKSFGKVNAASMGPLQKLTKAVWKAGSTSTDVESDSGGSDSDSDGDDGPPDSKRLIREGVPAPSSITDLQARGLTREQAIRVLSQKNQQAAQSQQGRRQDDKDGSSDDDDDDDNNDSE